MKPLLLLGLLASASSLLANLMSEPNDPVVAVSLTGRIIDAQFSLPLEFATVSAFDSDQTLATGASTDSLGNFQLVLPKGEYRFKFEFLGYTTLDTQMTLTSNVDLGEISLQNDAVALDAAEVTATRSQLTLKLDKQIFDVGSDITSQGGSANEVLDNVPQVTVSPEGVVSLRGSSGVKVLINGKPSALADNNALQGIPAANIDKVEIMTSPSAKYEAAGSAGIINIILKDASAKSWGGQLSATIGVPAEYRLNGSFSHNRDKWTVFGNIGLRYSEYFSTGTAKRVSFLPSGKQLLNETLSQDRIDRANNFFAGFDFRPNEKATLSASYSRYHQVNDDLSDVDYVFKDGAAQVQRDWQTVYTYLEPETYHQIEATYAQDLAKEGQKLFVLFQHDFWDNDEQELTVIDELFPAANEELRLRTRTLESSDDYLLQVDYEQPLSEHIKLETGLRAESRVISSDYIAEEKTNDEFLVYRGLKNKVDYYERIGGVYAQIAFEKDKLGIQAGLRSEYTNILVTDEVDQTEDIKKSYNWIFPTATLSYSFTDDLSSSLTYSKRIQRPGFWQLNPFGGIENPNEIQFGNPDLDPSFRDLVEFRLLFKKDKITITPNAGIHLIDGFYDTYVQQDETGLVTYFPVNLDQERIVAAGLTVTYTPVSGWEITGEGGLAEFTQRGVYEEVDFGNQFRTSNVQLSVRGKLPLGIRLQSSFRYFGGQRYLQSFRDPFYGVRAGMSRKFLDDRLQLSLNVRNLFELEKYRGGATLPSFSNQYERVWTQQRIGLTAAWDIGADVRQRRARGSIR